MKNSKCIVEYFILCKFCLLYLHGFPALSEMYGKRKIVKIFVDYAQFLTDNFYIYTSCTKSDFAGLRVDFSRRYYQTFAARPTKNVDKNRTVFFDTALDRISFYSL